MVSAGVLLILTSCLASGLGEAKAPRTPHIPGTPIKVTKDVGQPLTLDCRVPKGEGTASVEWVKLMGYEKSGQRSAQVLAYGDAVLVKEPRIQVRQIPEQVSLEIGSLEGSDGGTYECRLRNKSLSSVELVVRSPPILLDMSTKNVVVREGHSATLACFATGYPQPVVYWSRTEGAAAQEPKITGNLLTITNVTRADKGKYYCEAVNGLGSASQVVELDVVYPPLMLSSPTRAVIPEGGALRLACQADGSPAPQVYWSREEDFSPEQAQASGQFLPLNNITRRDSGAYHCLAVNSLGATKLSSQVQVVYPPVILDTGIGSVLAPEGGTAVLSCRASGSPSPQIFWSRIQNFTAEGSVPSGPIVNITNLTPGARGRYFCLARNSLGEARHSIDLEVEFSPIFLSPISAVEVEEGDKAELDCSSLGYPQARVYWSLNETATPSNRLYEGATLTIESISRAHRGRYHCLARNEVGEARKSLEVRVAFPPSFLSDGSELAYVEGDTGHLDCSADGFPLPNVYWGRSPDFNATEATYTGSTYDIYRVSKHSRGQYFCMAENRLGVARKRINVEIKFRPKLYISTPVTSGVVGGETELNCQVSGYPPPEISWEKSGSALENGPHYRITEIKSDGGLIKSSLLVSNIQESQFGLYKCKGQNELGQDVATVNLLQIQARAPGLQGSRASVPTGSSPPEPVPVQEETKERKQLAGKAVELEPRTTPPSSSTAEPEATEPAKAEFVKVKIAVKKGGGVAEEGASSEFPLFLAKYKSRVEDKQGPRSLGPAVIPRTEKLHRKLLT